MSNRVYFLSVLLLLLACKEEPIPIPPIPDPVIEEGVIAVYQTNADGSLVLALSPDSLPLVSPNDEGVQISVNPDLTYQKMEGYGAALTESSAYVLMEYLSESERSAILKELFSQEEGIGISYLRLTMGASDFSLSNYTYNDLGPGETDTDMQSFSLGKDRNYVIPVLQEILAIAPELSIMATPWTAPAWMKTNQRLLDGGRLTPAFYQAHARYFVRYLADMKAEGIPIQAITVQNEPLHQASYPSMNMSSSEQKSFIRDYLGPALEEAGVETKVIIYDHNWDDVAFPLDILSDPTAKNFVAGTSFHCYAGDVEAMSTVQQAHPDRGIYFTECSGGDWSPDFGANLAWNMDNLFVGATRNWAKTVLLWNLALDENNGPQNGGCTDCRGVITVNSGTGNITRNVEYALLGHSAQFVKPGACRIETEDTRSSGLSQVAFQNPDQSFALLAYNHLNRPLELEIKVKDNQVFRYELPAGTLVTFQWEL
ncbi:MAG: hypothetical protein NWR72_08140 [Bacteroidia bacterium]|nr:hypothetical protein [Bacteroidia bacterium]